VTWNANSAAAGRGDALEEIEQRFPQYRDELRRLWTPETLAMPALALPTPMPSCPPQGSTRSAPRPVSGAGGPGAGGMGLVFAAEDRH